jgi:hypothetical protein
LPTPYILKMTVSLSLISEVVFILVSLPFSPGPSPE